MQSDHGIAACNQVNQDHDFNVTERRVVIAYEQLEVLAEPLNMFSQLMVNQLVFLADYGRALLVRVDVGPHQRKLAVRSKRRFFL
jgi:hypothetical protein